MVSLADNLNKLSRRIENATELAGRKSGSVKLLAVSKTREAEQLFEALQHGAREFGENYLSEALEKKEKLERMPGTEGLVWHFIGPIQSNKTKPIAENFSWVHSVDRLKIAQRLAAQRPTTLGKLNICVQVNIDQEETKAGVNPAELTELLAQIDQLEQLSIRGLMAIPDPTLENSNALQRMQDLFEQVKQQYPSVDTLSMGMSGDLEEAVAHGSTMVRIGTDLFGPRPPKV